MDDRVLVLHELGKDFGSTTALDALSCEIRRGEIVGLLGPNGAGKTTTIEILEGLLAPTAGTVEIFGQTWDRNEAEIKQRVGVSLQETQLSERLTVRETLTLFRSFYWQGLEPSAAIARVMKFA